jgi:CRISPR/Cas system type I-B associated protein Csh2 (Cas7 group RAMP superfamily)
MAKHTSAQIADAFSEITSKFFDYRLFGGVILQGDVDRLLGPVSTQGPWRSIDPVVIDQSTITRMYVQKAGSEGDRNVTMGQQYLVRYAMFRGGIDFYPVHARKTKPTAADLRLLVEALCRCWTTTDPTSQRKMHLRELTSIIHCRSIDDGGVGWRTVDRAAVVTPLGRVAESPSDYEVVSKLTPEDEKIVRVFRFTETSSNAELDAFEAALTSSPAALDPYAKLPAISFVVHVECSNSNPNGDPDNENKPRHIIRNGADVYAEMTNVCVNRRSRTISCRCTAPSSLACLLLYSMSRWRLRGRRWQRLLRKKLTRRLKKRRRRRGRSGRWMLGTGTTRWLLRSSAGVGLPLRGSCGLK